MPSAQSLTISCNISIPSSDPGDHRAMVAAKDVKAPQQLGLEARERAWWGGRQSYSTPGRHIATQ